jgi:hypothetical protein
MLLTVTINGAPYAILTATQTANYIWNTFYISTIILFILLK